MLQRQIYILSFVFTLASLGGLVLLLAAWSPGPKIEVSLPSLAERVEVVDRWGNTVFEGDYNEFVNASPQSDWYEAKVLMSDEIALLAGDNKGVYFSATITPIKVLTGRSTMATYGDFSTGRRQRQDTALLHLTGLDSMPVLQINFRLDRYLSGNHATILQSSGVGEYSTLQYEMFSADFVSSYGFLGLIFVYVSITFTLLILWANFGGSPVAIYLAVVSASLAYTCFVFSRIYASWEAAGSIVIVHYINYLVPLPFVALLVRLSQPTKALKLATTFVFLLGALLLVGFAGYSYFGGSSSAEHAVVLRSAYLGYLCLWALLGVLTIIGVPYLTSTDNFRKATVIIAFLVILFGYVNDIARMTFRDSISNNIGPYYWFVAFLLFLAGIFNFVHQRYKNSIVNEKTLTIAKTTQMLAHDVRKPFSMIENLLLVIKTTNDTELLKKLVGEHLQDVKKAIHNVNAMLQDITEISAPANKNMESISMQEIIKASLKEVVDIFPDQNMVFHFNFVENRKLLVAPYKVQRVISNIVANAFQAMPSDGDLFFTCAPVGRSNMCELIIKNTGSGIEAEDIPRLFDAFFTKGKRKGTGLGLAISKKIVTDHGGEIRCRSDLSEPSVTFSLTLPTDMSSRVGDEIDLPSAVADLRPSEPALEISESTDPYTYKVESRTIKIAADLGRPILVGLLDDEEIYHMGLKSLVKAPSEMAEALELKSFTSSAELFDFLTTGHLDVLICDVDLGGEKFNGFNVVSRLREEGVSIPICIHSNRISSSDYTMAIDVGAQAFLPKPMGRNQLLRFILGNFKARDEGGE